MWKSIKPVLAQIFTSKKALYTIAGIIVYLLALKGVVLDQDAVVPVLALIGVLVFGQGLADLGKEGKKIESETIASLGKSSPPPVRMAKVKK